jgi:LPXTG-motif cell wall-anchored protein
MRRCLLVAVLAASAVGLTAAPAAAKEGVEATLTAPIPLAAAPGDEITVAWNLAYEDDEGGRQPFGASGIYVRLVSVGGGEPTVGRATGGSGRYEATVLVPEGGIGGVQIGLQGWASDPEGTHRSDLFFPITNNPLPAVQETSPAELAESAPARAAPEATGGSISPLWMALVGLTLIAAAAVLVVLLLRRRRRPAAA